VLDIARAKSGDADACAALFEAHKQHVYALCLRATADVEQAEELTQEVFVHVFRKLSTFRGDSNFSSWLYPIVVKAVSTHLERKSNHDVVFEQPLVNPFGPESPDKRDMTVPAIITLSALNDDPVAAPALAMLDVLGEPVLLRVVQSLRDSKVGPIFLLVNSAIAKSTVIRQFDRSEVNVIVVADDDFRTATQAAMVNCRERGMQSALVMRAPTYIECDVVDMLKFHNRTDQQVTFVADNVGRLEAALIDCFASEATAAFLSKGSAYSAADCDYTPTTYVNRLRTPADLRQLAEDALMQRCRIRPRGVEVRAGVWIGEGARVHRHVRTEGPVYIGANAHLRAGVIVKHCASIERNCEIDRGCIIDSATILAGTYLGVGLEIAHAVVNQNRLIDLKRAIDVEIEDPGLMGAILVSRRAWLGSLLASLAPSFSAATWRPLIDRLENALPANNPVPVPVANKVSYAGSKPWTVFDELPRAINSERV
jgi:RNA polymerase sigma factor (sigma-70 family)